MERKKLYVSDIMTEHVVTIKETTTIKDAAHLLLRDRVHGFPVTDDEGRLVGLVTISDLFHVLADRVLDMSFGNFEHLFSNLVISVGEIMTKEVLTFTPDTPIEEVIRTAVVKDAHTFPVLKEGKLVGIIGKHDILNIGFSYFT